MTKGPSLRHIHKKNEGANSALIHQIQSSPPDPNGRVVTEPRGRAQGLASQ